MQTIIIIPARYASTRLPGKPLEKICGQTMLQRVVRLSQIAVKELDNTSVIVAVDDEKIANHCLDIGVMHVMTRPECPSGTDRVAEVVNSLQEKPDFILNMQGDAPLTPPSFLRSLIDAYAKAPCDAITPVNQLTWKELEKFRNNKNITPFSGTTVTFDENTGSAFWFSKSVIPTIRDENKLRESNKLSPVFRHIGLYGYSYAMLKKYIELPQTKFEKLEGLEQLRLLEHGYTIRCVPVDFAGMPNMSGVDSPEDIVRAEQLIAEHGELF